MSKLKTLINELSGSIGEAGLPNPRKWAETKYPYHSLLNKVPDEIVSAVKNIVRKNHGKITRDIQKDGPKVRDDKQSPAYVRAVHIDLSFFSDLDTEKPIVKAIGKIMKKWSIPIRHQYSKNGIYYLDYETADESDYASFEVFWSSIYGKPYGYVRGTFHDRGKMSSNVFDD